MNSALNEEPSEERIIEKDERCAREKIDGKKCSSVDIKVYIMHEGERLPICEVCSDELADSMWETKK